MERDGSQFRKNGRTMKSPSVMLYCVVLFSLLLFAATDVRAADPSAGDYPSKPIEYVTHAARAH